MYSPSEQPYSLQSLSSSELSVLPHTIQSATQLIENIIPDGVWGAFENAASNNGFYYQSEFKSHEQQKISKVVLDQLGIFWDKALEFEAQGYKLHELKLQIHFKSEIAKTEVTCEVIANKTGGDFIVTQSQIDAAPTLVTTNTTIINPDSIPLVIAAVREGRVSDVLPNMMVENIKLRLTENPNWMENEITQMDYEERMLPLYNVTIKPSLSVNKSSSESMIDNQAVPIMSLTSSECSTEVSSFVSEDSLSISTISSESKMASGLCSVSFFTAEKRAIAAELSTPTDLSLTTGSK